MIFGFEERYNFYTNNVFDGSNFSFTVPKEYKTHRQDMPLFFEDEYKRKFLIIENDGYDNFGLPCLQKTRVVDNHSKFSFLHRSYIEGRHWCFTASPNPKESSCKDFSWEEKINEIFWRGSPTGNGDRIKFCENYSKKYNVGLIVIWDWWTDEMKERAKYFIKKEVSFKEYSKFKYLVSIEGNEKDSGINWKLASNSVVLMRRPKFESWLMESKLIPWIHYVPLEESFLDLEEKYNWCLSNDKKCKEISNNASKFMENFSNRDFDLQIEKKIKEDYNKYIKLI